LITDVLNVAAVDDATALREAHRVLLPGGLLAANVPAFACLGGAHDVAVCTTRRYHRPALGRLLAASGFTVRRLTYWNTLLFPLAWTVRRLRRTSHALPASDLGPLPRLIDAALSATLAGEAVVARFFPMPFGTSVLAVAVKP
jgi:hypothetical protein